MTEPKVESYGSQSSTKVETINGKQVTSHVVWQWAGGDGVWRVVDERSV